jgi:hypothetical protein
MCNKVPKRFRKLSSVITLRLASIEARVMWPQVFERLRTPALDSTNARLSTLLYLTFKHCMLLNVAVEWITLLLRIREAPGSNLSPEIGYPDCHFRGFPQSLQVNVGIAP